MDQSQAEFFELTSPPLKDQVYIRRLKHGIDDLHKYLRQADVALEALEECAAKVSASTDPTLHEKLDLVALYDSSARIPFLSAKSDVLDAALTSFIVQERLKQTQSATRWLESEIANAQGTHVSEFLSNVAQVHEGLIVNLHGSLAALDTDHATLDEDLDKYVVTFPASLEIMTMQAGKWNIKLKLHLKRLALKYLAVQSTNMHQTLDDNTLRSTFRDIMAVLEKLLQSLPQVWHDVLPHAHIDAFLHTLARDNVIYIRSDTESGLLRVRLRDFTET